MLRTSRSSQKRAQALKMNASALWLQVPFRPAFCLLWLFQCSFFKLKRFALTVGLRAVLQHNHKLCADRDVMQCSGTIWSSWQEVTTREWLGNQH